MYPYEGPGDSKGVEGECIPLPWTPLLLCDAENLGYLFLVEHLELEGNL